ncbi:hypothetical protein D3C85_948820 [compost metagenome]
MAPPLHELLAILLGYARRPGIGLCAQQQRPGITVELGTSDFIGKLEKTPQAVQPLFLILETLFDATEALAGKQFETLMQLPLVELVSSQRQQRSQQATCHERQESDEPGRDIFIDKAEDFWANGMQRHKRDSQCRCAWVHIGVAAVIAIGHHLA